MAAAATLAMQAHAAGSRVLLSPPLAAAQSGVDLVPAFIDVNLAGFQAFGDFGDPLNTRVFVNIAPGSTVTGWDYNNFSFTTSGASWLSAFVISVNNSAGSEWFDAAPSGDDVSGTFGPASGTWDTVAGGFGTGPAGPFVSSDGVLLITVYQLFADAGLNATVNAGSSIRIHYDSPTVIPVPGTFGLMGLGLLAVLATRRRLAN
jgi:hypothetical protein